MNDHEVIIGIFTLAFIFAVGVGIWTWNIGAGLVAFPVGLIVLAKVAT